MHAARNPDGSFTYDGQRYRLAERPDDRGTFDVLSDVTLEPIGSLRVKPAEGAGPVVELVDDEPPGALVAISTLLESPVGTVPLQ